MCGEGPYEILWTPWRMRYIEGHERSRGCVFCELPGREDREALILYRGRHAYVVLNKYPYNTAHTMIVPYRHVASLLDLGDEELREIAVMTRAVMRAIKEEYRPHAFNVGANIGEPAGAGIAGHFHVHIVPRWCGDTNFTMILARTKVLPESLDRTWERLRPRVEEACRRECAGPGG